MAVICVSGDLGSGKTTLSKKLAEVLRYKYSYTGGIIRSLARERSMTLEAFFKVLADDPELERSIDARQNDLMRQCDNLIVEGRIAPFFAECPYPKINILCTVDFEEGARRQLKRPENEGIPFMEMLALSRERLADERRRYLHLYDIADHFDPKHFDIHLDMTHRGPDELLHLAVAEIAKLALRQLGS